MAQQISKKSQNLTKQEQKTIEKHVNNHLSKNLHKQLPKHLSKHLITKQDFVASQVKHHTLTAIIAAFSFLMALTWKDFIVEVTTDLINPLNLVEHPYLAHLYSAIIVTVISILGIFLMVRWAKKPEVLVSEGQTRK